MFEWMAFLEYMGGHQVAQKLINTTFPFKSSKLTTSPFSFLKEMFDSLGSTTATAASSFVGAVFILFSAWPQKTKAKDDRTATTPNFNLFLILSKFIIYFW